MVRLRESTSACGFAFGVASVLLALLPWPGRVLAQSAAQSAASGAIRTPLGETIYWSRFHDSGWKAMGKGWYDTAEREFTTAIRIAKRPEMGDSRVLARSYSSLAWALQKQGRNAEAEPLARWALETREARFGANAEPVARSLNQMATIYLALGRFNQAEPLLRRVLAMNKVASTTIDRGRVVPLDASKSTIMLQEQAQSESLLGLGYVVQRRFAEAEAEFARAVALREASQGSKHPETGDELNNLAWARLEQGKLAEARPTMEKSLDILEQGRGVQDPSVARALDGLARIDAGQNDLSAAETKYLRLIAIYESLGTGQESRLNDGLKRYADLLDRMGRSGEAGRVRDRLPRPRPAGEAKSGAPKPGAPAIPDRGRS